MHKLDTVIFDLDGTLLNTIEDIAASVNVTLSRWGRPERTVAEVRDFVGNGLRRTLTLALGEDRPLPEFEEALAFLIRHYEENCLIKTAPYPGILPLLDALKARGYKLGIVSNKTDPAVKHLHSLFFSGTVGAAIGEHPGVRRKPAPDTVFEAMALLGSAPESCIYVGDSEVDLLTARNSGIPCISVLWGFRDKEDMEAVGAEIFCENTADLAEKIEELIHGK